MTSGTRGIGKSVHSSDQAAFCELMVGARKSAGLTQHALALRLKKPQSFVAKYEGGERRLDVVEFIVIARALGVDPLKLMATLVAGGKAKSASPKRAPRSETPKSNPPVGTRHKMLGGSRTKP
jgi:transcriptional regulator with XRE-family HTH domain